MNKISSKQNVLVAKTIPKNCSPEHLVLVAVVKNRRDLNLILKQSWYRIPLEYAPKQKFKYLAFYGPISGNLGGKITYYASIKKITRATRRELLPREVSHPRIHNLYLRFELGKIFKLPKPIRNKSRRRVSFGFTTLSLLKKAKDILDLYGVPPIEEIFEKALKKVRIKYVREYVVSSSLRQSASSQRKSAPQRRKRYRLDFAIFPSVLISSKSGLISSKQKITIECDGAKSHSLFSQKIRDRAKDKFLRQAGWQILRFTEKEIIENANGAEGSRGIDACILKLKSLWDKG